MTRRLRNAAHPACGHFLFAASALAGLLALTVAAEAQPKVVKTISRAIDPLDDLGRATGRAVDNIVNPGVVRAAPPTGPAARPLPPVPGAAAVPPAGAVPLPPGAVGAPPVRPLVRGADAPYVDVPAVPPVRGADAPYVDVPNPPPVRESWVARAADQYADLPANPPPIRQTAPVRAANQYDVVHVRPPPVRAANQYDVVRVRQPPVRAAANQYDVVHVRPQGPAGLAAPRVNAPSPNPAAAAPSVRPSLIKRLPRSAAVFVGITTVAVAAGAGIYLGVECSEKEETNLWRCLEELEDVPEKVEGLTERAGSEIDELKLEIESALAGEDDGVTLNYDVTIRNLSQGTVGVFRLGDDTKERILASPQAPGEQVTVAVPDKSRVNIYKDGHFYMPYHITDAMTIEVH